VSGPENNSANAQSLTLHCTPPRPCSYLEGRRAKEHFTLVSHLDGAAYEVLIDLGFRRSGLMVYRPACDDCNECVPLRIPVDHFSPSRSQRRVMRRNADVRVEIDTPRCTEEKWRLYLDYLEHQHEDNAGDTFMDFQAFLYTSPTETIEITYRVGDRIVAAGLVDVCPNCLSSVYLYFDPTHARRSLGVFGALCEIEECRRRGLTYWHVGLYVQQCPQMNYKAHFRPHERLGPDGVWR
jgi:arginine-tRNA-protein transferase